MPFDQAKFDKPVSVGDVGVVAYVMQSALGSLTTGLETVAAATGQDVSDEVASIREDVARLETFFREMTGWKPE